MGKSESKTITQWIWSWVVLGGIVLFLLGTGVSFMTAAHPHIADLFFVAGSILFLFKFLSWDLSKRHKQKRSIQVIAIISTLIIMAIAIGGNHSINCDHSTAIPYEMIKEWGLKNGFLSIEIDGKYLSSYKDKYNLLFIGAVPLMGTDKMTNKFIAKSAVYRITDGEIILAVNISGIPIPSNYATEGVSFQHILALIPINVPSDKISTLLDVERMGGKIIAQRGGKVFPNR